MGQGDDEGDEEYEDTEQVLFQGPMFGREANLKKNPRLVKAALVQVKRMISDGLARRAHTILLEPTQGRIAIRFVVDGIPYPAGALPGQRGIALIQMTKVLAGLNPQERTAPQSGGINAEFDGTRYELYTDFVPLKPGVERLRIRVENPKITYLKPASVGMPEDLSKKLRSFTEDSKGIILACGPPETGVTSLSICALHCVDPYLYSVFNLADVGNKELINVTDYEGEEGHDLELSLDRIIRREADIIYMGKLTDPAVVQTMFTFADRLCFVAEIGGRTPAEAIKQLIEWVGTEAVAQHLRGVVTQKLIRTLCDDCKQAFRPNPQLLKRLSLPPETTVLYRAPAPPDPEDEDAPTVEELCADCDGVPYHGRTAAFELLEMTEGMKDVVLAGAEPDAIKQQMSSDGMRTIQKDALRLVAEGKTSLEEVQRVFAPPRGRRPKGRRPRPRPQS
ncbi:ATPase, T2SS/T4P/T4SS family [Fuerstiella marisgermanici]|uniref:Type II traffic warden ATPase n=1 Tax=Fuerstiella marisgermanici TaxID=1891926 RepID=A0A1P8WFG4_9PLAN|nr:ATPase, T2SS/T4P/T4SS family [Fuerstiella marisgermanici]APZ92781.1 Type II traffic warden ATPase [Fuerstiella marisgermanici]